MGKEFQMARSETVPSASNRHSTTKDMLLASGRTGISGSTSAIRNEREKAITAKQKAKGRKAKAPTPKSKTRTKAEDLDGSSAARPKSKGYRRYDKDRQPDRGAKGADKTPRRSSSELGITWIGSFCPDGQPHFLIGRHNFDGGVILNCQHCRKDIWLPTHMGEAARLDILIDRYGANKGYQLYLDRHREAKCMVAKLQDLWSAKQRMEDNGEFVKLVISVMEDKEYDKIK